MVHASPLLPPKQHTHTPKKKSHSLSLLFHSFCWFSFLAVHRSTLSPLFVPLILSTSPQPKNPFFCGTPTPPVRTVQPLLHSVLLSCFHILTCLALKQNKSKPPRLSHTLLRVYCFPLFCLFFLYTHTHTLTSFLSSTPPPPFANKTPTQNQNHFPLSFSL